MTENKGLFVLLDEIVQKYIKEYFNIRSGSFEEEATDSDIFVDDKDLVYEVVPREVKSSVFALDGSSRSLVSAGGIISISTLAISSSFTPVYGVYPSLFGLPSLQLKRPFIAIASSTPTYGKIEPFLYSSNSFLTSVSLAGEPFLSTYDPDRIETEIRGVLETEALKITKEKGLTILDGPLFPSYIYLPERVKQAINSERKKIIDNNYIGVVKRLDKSNLLISSISRNKDFENKYKVTPRNFLSDESFLYQLVRFNFSPPYPILAIGPIIRKTDEKITYFIHYLIVPYHKYVPKFSILRVESLKKDAIEYIASLPFSRDGIPKILSVADKTAKELSNGILKYIIFSLSRIGLQESFRDKFEVNNIV